MKRVKSWKAFKINENRQSAWGSGPFNGSQPTSLIGGSPIQPNDPQLTTDAFDRLKSNIINSQLKLGQLTQNIFNQVSTPKSVADLKLEKLNILSIEKNESGGIDLLIEFKFENFDQKENYYGKFINWGAFNNTTFKTTFASANVIFNKKVEAILKRTLMKWFEPELGDYRMMKSQCRTYDNMGTVYELKEGARIKVVNVQLENAKPMIHMKVGKNWRYLTDLDYWFFKWWFEKIPAKAE